MMEAIEDEFRPRVIIQEISSKFAVEESIYALTWFFLSAKHFLPIMTGAAEVQQVKKARD